MIASPNDPTADGEGIVSHTRGGRILPFITNLESITPCFTGFDKMEIKIAERASQYPHSNDDIKTGYHSVCSNGNLLCRSYNGLTVQDKLNYGMARFEPDRTEKHHIRKVQNRMIKQYETGNRYLWCGREYVELFIPGKFKQVKEDVICYVIESDRDRCTFIFRYLLEVHV